MADDAANLRPDRNLALELVRTTEAAALSAARLVGMGDKEGADQAAVDAMRLVLDGVQMDGTVVIGEGEKDEAPMLYNGERVGDGQPPEVDVAVDPLEGTTLTAKGQPNALAVIALSERNSMFDPGPCVYMEKISGADDIADLLDLDRPLGETLGLVAERRGKDIRDVMVVMLDRPRNEDAMAAVRDVGARLRLISHGDVSAALLAVSDNSPVDVMFGIGGTPEGVISAAATKCLARRVRRAAVAARRRRARRRDRRRLRPRAPARPGRARQGQRLLLRRDRRHRRRRAAGRALPDAARRDDRVARHALAHPHGAAHPGASQPREAARVQRRPVRVAASRRRGTSIGYAALIDELRARWAPILDGLGEGVTIQTVDGRVLYANQAVADQVGLTVEQLVSAEAGRAGRALRRHRRARRIPSSASRCPGA